MSYEGMDTANLEDTARVFIERLGSDDQSGIRHLSCGHLAQVYSARAQVANEIEVLDRAVHIEHVSTAGIVGEWGVVQAAAMIKYTSYGKLGRIRRPVPVSVALNLSGPVLLRSTPTGWRVNAYTIERRLSSDLYFIHPEGGAEGEGLSIAPTLAFLNPRGLVMEFRVVNRSNSPCWLGRLDLKGSSFRSSGAFGYKRQEISPGSNQILSAVLKSLAETSYERLRLSLFVAKPKLRGSIAKGWVSLGPSGTELDGIPMGELRRSLEFPATD